MWNKTPELEIVQLSATNICTHIFFVIGYFDLLLNHIRGSRQVLAYIVTFYFDLEGEGCHFARSSG